MPASSFGCGSTLLAKSGHDNVTANLIRHGCDVLVVELLADCLISAAWSRRYDHDDLWLLSRFCDDLPSPVYGDDIYDHRSRDRSRLQNISAG